MAKLVIMTRSSKIMSWKLSRQRKTIDEISDETQTAISTLRPFLRKKFKDEATKLWAVRVKEKAGNVCELPCCGKTNCEAHHIISKGSHPQFRYEEKNGMCLCNDHHYFNPIVSGHFSTSSGFNLITLLETVNHERWAWFMAHRAAKAYQQIDFEAEYWKLADLGV